MQVNSHPEFLEIILFPTEMAILQGIFQEIDRTYAIPADQLESNIRNVWFSGEGFRSVEMSEDDIAEWNQSLQEFRGHNRSRCQEWIAILAKGGDPLLWRVPREEVDTLLIVLNDYRLYQAAKNQLDESELDGHFGSIDSVSKYMAMTEIRFLAWLMEMLLCGISPGIEET